MTRQDGPFQVVDAAGRMQELQAEAAWSPADEQVVQQFEVHGSVFMNMFGGPGWKASQ